MKKPIHHTDVFVLQNQPPIWVVNSAPSLSRRRFSLALQGRTPAESLLLSCPPPRANAGADYYSNDAQAGVNLDETQHWAGLVPPCQPWRNRDPTGR